MYGIALLTCMCFAALLESQKHHLPLLWSNNVFCTPSVDVFFRRPFVGLMLSRIKSDLGVLWRTVSRLASFFRLTSMKGDGGDADAASPSN